MRNYWSCSKFADWLRGTMKPYAETGKGWRSWEQEAKACHPIRYWIVEEALDKIQNFIWWPADKLYDVKYYINNRFVTRTHSLTADSRDIKPGQWRDLGDRFLPCLFNELVNFVEIELAWRHIIFLDKHERQKYKPPFWAWGWFRWRAWRSAQAGLDYLKWECSLVWTEEDLGENRPEIGQPTHQAIKAQEILELYTWWTEVYPKRPDPMDASGWTEHCAKRRNQKEDLLDFEYKTEEEKKEVGDILDLCQKIEQEHEQEDEQMMFKLIKLRQYLWS